MEDTTKQEVPNAGIRLASMAIDHFIMIFIIMIVAAPGMILSMVKEINQMHQADSGPFMFSGWVMYVALFGFSLYFCKDCIQGRSIAKRILKLQVVNNKTGEAAGPIRCFVRNIFCTLWFVEWIVVLVNPGRRIGDFVAGTKVVKFDPTKERPKVNFLQLIIALVLAYGMLFLFMLPFKSLNMGGSRVKFVKTSYNDAESKATEKLFADSLGQILTAKVDIYDTIRGIPGEKYITVVFELKKDYLEEDGDFRKIKSFTVPLLLTKFPRKTFIGRLKYIYEVEGSMITRSFQLDWEDEK
jgi:uncharacterized RDD family membrane protein YckC